MELARAGIILLHVCSCIQGSSALSKGQKLRLQAGSARANLSEALRAESIQLNEQLQRAADALPEGPTKEFLETLRLCAPCKTYKRIGETSDGGYVMCMDGLDKGLMGAMSYGISGYDGWGMKVASLFHIPLHEYDCTNFQEPAKCTGCEVHFHPECIRSVNAIAEIDHMNHKTLAEQISAAGLQGKPKESLLMKIDVEAAEWEIFADEPISSLQMFREIVVEYHWLGDTSKHLLYAQAVKKLADAGFRVTHLHGNNFGGPLQHFGEYSIPNVLEVTYIRGQGCTSGIPYGLPEDMPNNPGALELEDAQLPASK